MYHVCVESPVADSRGHEHSYSYARHFIKQTVYQCPLCARLTMSMKLLLNHLAKHSLQSQTGRHHCATCGKEFSRASVLASHIHVVHRGHLYSVVFRAV